MSDALHAEKLSQAVELVRESGVHVWLTFVRETAENPDPALGLLMDGGLTWQSALLVGRDGQKIAVVGNYDADPLNHSGHWDEVIGYVQGIRVPLLEVLERLIPNSESPRIAVNFSTDDDKADGLTHGMYLLLDSMLRGTRFEGSLESAASIVGRLRGRKTVSEVARMRAAIAEGDRLFEIAEQQVRLGLTERALYTFIQAAMDQAGLGYAWDRTGNPIVNFGPHSMIGHGIASDSIQLEAGHIIHIDLGVTLNGYSSDIQRCWYVSADGNIPDSVTRAFDAVNLAISNAAAILRPGVAGWEVDAAARRSILDAGYPEYLHAVGHQVGRVAHDGGGVLAPRWERYGQSPFLRVEERQVYTLELGVTLPEHGYLGLEEMVWVGADGIQWLSQRQLAMKVLHVKP